MGIRDSLSGLKKDFKHRTVSWGKRKLDRMEADAGGDSEEADPSRSLGGSRGREGGDVPNVDGWEVSQGSSHPPSDLEAVVGSGPGREGKPDGM